MPKGIPCLTEIQKQEIIKRVTDKGERAVDLAKEFKVDPKIIYNLLKTKANQHQAILELAKLKRALSPFFKQKLPSKLINSDYYIFLIKIINCCFTSLLCIREM